MKKYLTLLVLCLPLMTTAGEKEQSQFPAIKFSDYPANVVEITSESRHKAVIKDENDSKTKELLQSLETEDVNFAGHYTINGMGCGTACVALVALDLSSGEHIQDRRLGLSCRRGPMEFFSRPDSRLLVTIGRTEATEDDEENCMLDYYVEENGQFKIIKSELWNERDMEILKKQLN